MLSIDKKMHPCFLGALGDVFFKENQLIPLLLQSRPGRRLLKLRGDW
jgi:hypothetical protein